MDDLLSNVEVGRLAGVGPTAVKRWADQGLLPCVRTAGGHRRFRRDEVEKFLLTTRGSGGGGHRVKFTFSPSRGFRQHAVAFCTR